MLINEIGWPTRGGFHSGFLALGMDSAPIVPESKRARAYRKATRKISRTNCNLMGIVPQAWTSLEADPLDAEDWFGIANPATAKPYRSARAYSRSAKLMRGERRAEPPRRGITACSGMRASKPQLAAHAKLRRARSSHPRMRFVARAGQARLAKVKLRLPRRLRFASGAAWRHGVRARKGSRKLEKSALHHSTRKLAIKVGRRGARALTVKLRGRALRRVKPLRHRRLRFPVAARDVDRHRIELTIRKRVR